MQTWQRSMCGHLSPGRNGHMRSTFGAYRCDSAEQGALRRHRGDRDEGLLGILSSEEARRLHHLEGSDFEHPATAR